MKTKASSVIAALMLATSPDMLRAHVDTIVGEYRHDAAPPPPSRGRMSVALDPQGIDRYTRSVRVIASTPKAVEGQPAITRWDLTRFLKNPVVLWAHQNDVMPIAVASEIDPEDPAGLSMRIRFASSKVSEIAEQAWNGILEEVVKAVSVGYDLLPDGSAELAELSVVPIGLDEDAGTPALNPAADKDPTDEERAAAVKRAAAVMAKHLHHVRTKKRIMLAGNIEAEGEVRQKRADGEPAARFDLGPDEVLRMDVAPLRMDGLKDTPTGGKEMRARLTRVGVLKYRDPTMPDGWRRELRLPEDVFKADSLATLRGATVIDIKDHTGMVTPETWQKAAFGTVMEVREDGDHVDSVVHINAKAALDALAKGERQDVSCGYKCRLEWKSGEWRGEKYDCIQRDHVYNHVALCPPNGGRAGSSVGVRADSDDKTLPQWGIAHWDAEDRIMKIIRLDNRDIEYGSQDHLDTVAKLHKVDIEALGATHARAISEAEKAAREKIDAEKARADGAEQALESFKADLKEKEKDAEAKKAKDDEEYKKTRSARRQLERHAFRLLSRVKPDDEEEDDEEEDDGDEKKMPFAKKAKRSRTAKLDAFLDGATDRQIHERVIKSLPGGEKFDAADKSDVYVKVRYDSLIEQVGETLGNGIADVVRTVHQHQDRTDNLDGNNDALATMKAARAARDKAAREAGHAPPFGGGTPAK